MRSCYALVAGMLEQQGCLSSCDEREALMTAGVMPDWCDACSCYAFSAVIP
jgi:hypothetical protein